MVVRVTRAEQQNDRVFHALADPTRRDIVKRAMHDEHSVSALARHYPGPSRAHYASKALLNSTVAGLVADEALGLDVVSGGELFVALGVIEGGADHAALDLVERRSDREVEVAGAALRGRDRRREVFGDDRRALAEHDRALDHVLELAHVAGPVVAHQQIERGALDGDARLAVLAAVDVEEVIERSRAA